ncbi:hypothetical protein K3720_08145 [Leisingera caerulea]|uniref:hypothetical protein n=1 Tax=Leisingera caerulea TaxID=506591 RepID=UPI0021A2DEA7|nr:hypothetical protein [Leisingera caerulea]UWQ51376.1 hypothetical protein K3720_08145 [Leisingera caerulea]
MTRTVTELAKALLNATLILLALCLFLGWKLMAAASAVTANAAEITSRVEPLHTAVTGLQGEIASLRAAVQNGTDTVPPARLAPVEERLDQLQASLSEMRDLPQQAAAGAARAGAAEFAARLTGLLRCSGQKNAAPPG